MYCLWVALADCLALSSLLMLASASLQACIHLCAFSGHDVEQVMFGWSKMQECSHPVCIASCLKLSHCPVYLGVALPFQQMLSFP